jgi:hypothetical protein
MERTIRRHVKEVERMKRDGAENRRRHMKH